MLYLIKPAACINLLGIAMRGKVCGLHSAFLRGERKAPHYARYRLWRYAATAFAYGALCLTRLRRHNKRPTTRVGLLLWWGKLDSDQRSQ